MSRLVFEALAVDEENGGEQHLPKWIQAYVATRVEPKQCGPLMKRLSRELPLVVDSDKPLTPTVDLSHLKRVRRRTVVDAASEQTVSEERLDPSSNKRLKRTQDIQLDVCLGAVVDLDRKFGSATESTTASSGLVDLMEGTGSKIIKLNVPGRMAESVEENTEFQKVWPTAFFPNKTKEFRRKAELELTEASLGQMRQGMEAALKDAQEEDGEEGCAGVVIMSPDTGKIVARASQERKLQNTSPSSSTNPLSTAILLAIQGVSRIERFKAISQGMDNPSFQQGQYLCTGYDVFTTREPTAFEAMALVHSRIRRLIFLASPKEDERLGGLLDWKIHALPGTNHRYRVFQCHFQGDLNVGALSES